MKNWLEPKDLIYTFEVEKLINEFIETISGKLVSRLISNFPNFENADYLFPKENVLIELKCLQIDFPQSASFSKKVANLYDDWLIKREITFEMFLDYSKLPRNKRLILNKIYSEPLRRIIKKANRLLKSTEQHLSISNAQKLLFIVNDGLYSFEPSLLIMIICNILKREFSSIDGFVYFTVNSFIDVPNDDYARQIWVPAYSNKVSPKLPSFVNQIGNKWANFFGNKIGGFDDVKQTDGVEHLINSKVIRI